jgi:hypothetical protein
MHGPTEVRFRYRCLNPQNEVGTTAVKSSPLGGSVGFTKGAADGVSTNDRSNIRLI